jgi:hypothetical protein
VKRVSACFAKAHGLRNEITEELIVRKVSVSHPGQRGEAINIGRNKTKRAPEREREEKPGKEGI